jgi:hypothetical protein
MVKVELCSTKQHLLEEYDRATEKYLHALQELRANMATTPKGIYKSLLDASEAARLVSERARIALERHVETHAC